MVSRYGPANDVKLSVNWSKPVNVVEFYMNGTSWEVVMFFTREINNMCTIFTARHKLYWIHLMPTFMIDK